MAMLNGDQTKATFGPEWLSFKSGPSISEDDQSNQYNGAIKGGQRTHYSPTKKVPLRFTRSKSTPLLPVEETQGGEGQISKEKKTEDVTGVGGFAMLKERNLFDRNFPTLNNQKPRLNVSSVNLNTNFNSPPPSTNPSPPTSAIKSEATPSSAWKIPQSKANPLTTTNSPPNGVSLSPNGREGVETEMQLASLIVPNVQPPKVLTKNRVELLTKKGPPKKKFEASLLRKATSEPNLPIPPAYQENYAKLMAAARKGAPDPKHPPPKVIPEREKKLGTVVLNRNDFFKGRQKKESTSTSPHDELVILQHRRVASDEWIDPTSSNPLLVNPGEDDENPHHNNVPIEERTPSGSSSNANIEPRMMMNGFTIMEDEDSKHVNSNPLRSRSASPKLLSLEDEEKFLRNLGWAPEEEVHVPELSEEEIVEWEAKKLFWMSQMTQRKRLSLDVCIRKWQHDREGMFVTKIY